MLVIIEIILTIIAWIRGWKWWALVPGAVTFILGLMMGASGVTQMQAPMVVDVACIVSLIILVVIAPKETKRK